MHALERYGLVSWICQGSGWRLSRPDKFQFVERFATCGEYTANIVECGRQVVGTRHPRWGDALDAEKMKKCVWVRPSIVAVIEFLEWTEGDRLRHSKFVALREDKNPREVAKEA
jgi:hypothetical protein